MSKRLVTMELSVDEDGNIWQDTQTHGNTFAEVYRGTVLLKRELERVIAERRSCPHFPGRARCLGS